MTYATVRVRLGKITRLGAALSSNPLAAVELAFRNGIKHKTKQQIIGQLDRLSPEMVKVVYEFTLGLRNAHPQGTKGSQLLRFAGTIPTDDIQAMTKAIESGCEQVHEDDGREGC